MNVGEIIAMLNKKRGEGIVAYNLSEGVYITEDGKAGSLEGLGELKDVLFKLKTPSGEIPDIIEYKDGKWIAKIGNKEIEMNEGNFAVESGDVEGVGNIKRNVSVGGMGKKIGDGIVVMSIIGLTYLVARYFGGSNMVDSAAFYTAIIFVGIGVGINMLLARFKLKK